MAQRLYEIFRANRSIQSTAKQMNEEGIHTPSGAAFNASTTSCTVEKKLHGTRWKRSRETNKMPHQFCRAAWSDLTVEVYL